MRETIEEAVVGTVLKAANSDRGMEDFDKWLLGRSNTLVKQLSQSLGTSIDDAFNRVHQYLAEAGIRAMQYLSGCIQRLMKDVERCLLASGVKIDRKLFAMLYFPQAYFDNLPLILLREKLEFFEGTIESLRSDDADAVSEFQTMLCFYAQMVEDRRRIDRERSPSRASRRGDIDLDNCAPSIASDRIDTERVIEMLVKSGRLDCPCDRPQWISLSLQPASMSFRCTNCQSERHFGERQES